MTKRRAQRRDPMDSVIDSALQAGRFIGWNEGFSFDSGLRHVESEIVNIGASDPARAVTLHETCIAGCILKAEEIDDSGRLGWRGRNICRRPVLWLDRRSPEEAGKLMLYNSDSTRIPLREMADIYQTTGRYVVLHEATRRRQAVSSNVSGRDVASFVSDARKRIAAEVRFPSGVYAIFSGEAEAAASARREILLTSLVAGVGVVLLLAIAFHNFRNLILVLANLTFALAGGVLAIFLSGAWLTLGSLVGLITLFGISTRNSIMMISHFEHLVNVEGHLWGLETALRGASERLVPVLMTALVAGLGLLPIAIGSGDPGREIEGPMAIVILGGLATSTALNLLILPTLALRFGRFTATT